VKHILLVAITLMTVLGSRAAAQSGHELFQQALAKERAEGKLQDAIVLYQRVVKSAGSDHALAVKALLREAECHQKLGDAQANRIYERVVRDFADQKQAVTLARARLNANPPNPPSGDRVVKAGETITYGEGKISPDGRLISYVDDWLTGNLMVHDLVTGTDRPLTTNKDWGAGSSAGSSVFSPDGKQIAFGWGTFGASGISDLRVMRIDTAGGLDQSRRIATSDDVKGYSPTDWSPDGKWLAVTLRRADRTSQIGVIGLQDGSFRNLKTVGWRGPGKLFFSPDGKYLVYDVPASDAEGQRDVFILAVDGSRETRAVEHPANDVAMGWTGDGARVLFASDRTGPVGLWALPVAGGKPTGAAVLLKPDIGTVFSLGLTASGVLHILRDASTTALYVAPIDLGAGKLTGPPVLESFGASRPDWSRDGQQLAYPFRGHTNLLAMMIRSFGTGQLREVRPRFDYLGEPRWLSDGHAFITGGRDFQGKAGIYRIDAATGQEALLTDTDGFGFERVSVSPDGQKLYYTIDSNTALVERDLASGNVRTLHRSHVRVGAADVSPDGRFVAVAPLDWEAKTSRLMVVPVAGGEPRTLFEVTKPRALSGYGGLAWTGDSKAVVATVLEKVDVKELWLVPLSGDAPRKLDVDVLAWKQGFRLHPSGKQIAFFLGKEQREVWALESLRPAPREKK
jgi:Tol biopolymer transport system component